MNRNSSTKTPTNLTAAAEQLILLDDLLAVEPDTTLLERGPSEPKLTGVVVGTFAGHNSEGFPQVDYPGNPTATPLIARITVDPADLSAGRDVALMFESGDPRRPILLGVIQHPPVKCDSSNGLPADSHDNLPAGVLAELNDDRLVLRADKEIVLECGKSSVTLTRAGKVLIRGAYLLSRSSGVNRIKGGSVQIN